MHTTEHQHLVDACLEGGQDAWQAFVDEFSRLVYSIPKRYGFDDAACDDIFQDVFLAAYRKLHALRDAQSVPKWLITTTVRACGKHAKRARLPVPPPKAEQIGDEEMIRQERLHQLHRGLDQIGGRCRDLLLMLHGAREVSYDTVSESLGIPRGSIGPTRQRCLEKLARAMGGEDGL